MNRFKKKWQENLVFCADLLFVGASYALSFFLRFDGLPPDRYADLLIKTLPFVFAMKTTMLVYFNLASGIWRYASIADLTQILKAATAGSVLTVAALMLHARDFPRSVFIIDWLLLVSALSGTRFIIRLSRPLRERKKQLPKARKKILIVGAGDAGAMLAREFVYGYHNQYAVIGFVDDDAAKIGRRIHNIAVLGKPRDIPGLVAKHGVHEVIIAIPSLRSQDLRPIVEECIKSGAGYRTAPDLSEIINGTVKVKEIREVRIEDLLGRQMVHLNRQAIAGYIAAKVVLVTGAGGSIGSELCRQVARFSPKKLVLFEKAENPLFYIHEELAGYPGDFERAAVIGDICDSKRVREVFAQHRPQIVFHAAAHKHVPLAELNPFEAVKTNVFGTKTLTEEAMASGAEKFIMLSTDKVVAPTSVMGATKRIAEIYLRHLNSHDKTGFVGVRFGNVLGSEGSVVPIFKKQIERGGPVTVTHPEMKRYFMAIPEAAGLVLEAGFMGKGGEIFILEMGKQVKIADLARDMIRLSGFRPREDIPIVFTGLRPGEKMHEALINEDESLAATSHEKIMTVQETAEREQNIIGQLQELAHIVERADPSILAGKLKEIVPNYSPGPHLTKLPAPAMTRLHKADDIDILIADDEKIIQDLLSKFLEGRGYNTLLASNGREAIEIVQSNRVRLAIIDLKMPGFFDGMKTLKRIKRMHRDLDVILMTGFGSERTRRLSSRLGACAYLEKPFDLTKINRHIEDALHADRRGGRLP